MAQLTAYFLEFQDIYFHKDSFLLPYYLSKSLGIPCHYYYGHNVGNTPLPSEYRGVKFHDLGHKHMNKAIILYDMFRCVICNARKSKCVFFIHISWLVMLIAFIYRLINPKGKVVVMADLEADLARELASKDFVYSKGIPGIIKRFLGKQFFKHQIVTIGNLGALHALQEMYKRHGWINLVHVHPSLDNELFESLELKYRRYEKKENIFLYVGRIGNYQKNTDMLLDALSKIDLKDWKFYLIGPMTNSFDTREKSNYDNRIQEFFKQRPDLKDKVIFTGSITNSKTLFEYYLRAKVFVLSSRHEGFANVLSEAAALGCFIVSTDVGGASTVSNNWKFGKKIKQESSEDLAGILQAIINKEISIDTSKAINSEHLTWSYMVKRITDIINKTSNE